MSPANDERQYRVCTQSGAPGACEIPVKTGAERQAGREARLKLAGLKKVHNLWANPEDEPSIKAHAAKLARRRERKK